MTPKSLQVLLFDCLRKNGRFSPESPVISEDQELCLSGQGSFFGPECQGNPRGQQRGVHVSTKKKETDFKGQMIGESSYFYRILAEHPINCFWGVRIICSSCMFRPKIWTRDGDGSTDLSQKGCWNESKVEVEVIADWHVSPFVSKVLPRPEESQRSPSCWMGEQLQLARL